MFVNPKKHLATALAGAAADQTYQDLRSPDAVDAARAAGDPPAAGAHQDLRPPDTRDQAEGYNPTLAPEPVSPDGFDVPSAVLGAAAGNGLLIVLLAAGTLARRRPSTRRHRTVRA